MALNHVDKSGIVPKVAAEFDKLSDERLGLKGSEKLQSKLVEQVLIPLAVELMKEDPYGLTAILTKAQYKLQGGERRVEGRGLSQPRSNISPKL